jgi:uncharacterized protein (TIGR03066 family)
MPVPPSTRQLDRCKKIATGESTNEWFTGNLCPSGHHDDLARGTAMKAFMALALIFSLTATAAMGGQDGPKFDEAKLIGKWEPTDAKKDTRALMEFKKGGKLLLTVPIDGVDTIVEGNWKLKGGDLEIGLMRNNIPEMCTLKVTKLDDKTLEYTAPQGKAYTLKKMKG